MRGRKASHSARRAREFEAFVAGAAGRLLHTATLLTAEPPDANPRARRLLTLALAHTYADWDRLRGEDPYDRARRQLAVRFARTAWHTYGPLARYRPDAAGALARHRPGAAGTPGPQHRPGQDRPDPTRPAPHRSDVAGALARLTPRERLIVVLLLHEGVAEEQTAALLGLSTERVRALHARAVAALLHPPRGGPAPARVGVAPS